MSSVQAELVPVKPSSQTSIPVITHNGKVFVVSELGTEWHLRVRIIKPKRRQVYKVCAAVDGKCVGYSKTCSTHDTDAELEAVFQGFPNHAHDGSITYSAFKFGVFKPAASAATVDHPDQIKAGKIKVEVKGVTAVSKTQKFRLPDSGWVSDAANKKLPEGKKWFLQPGLKAEKGSTITSSKGWSSRVYCTDFRLAAFEMCYDTAENLVLRKILDPNKPAHRAILSASKDARIAAMGRRHAEAADRQQHRSSSRGTLRQQQEGRALGVKRERGQRQNQRGSDGGLEIPRSATAETINLTEDMAHSQPLTVGGHAVAADEMAVCDLVDSDDEPGWQVAKKQASEVSVM